MKFYSEWKLEQKEEINEIGINLFGLEVKKFNF